MSEYNVTVTMSSEFAKEFHSILCRFFEKGFTVLTFEDSEIISEFCGTLGDKILKGDADA